MGSFQPDQPAESAQPEATPSLDAAQGKGQENAAGSRGGARPQLFGRSSWLYLQAAPERTTCFRPPFPAPGCVVLLPPVLSDPSVNQAALQASRELTQEANSFLPT